MSDPMDSPPPDHGADRYDYVEVIGAPEGVGPMGEWWDKLLAEPCPDCRANVFVYWRTDEARQAEVDFKQGEVKFAQTSRWSYTVAHDDGCPTLTKLEGQ